MKKVRFLEKVKNISIIVFLMIQAFTLQTYSQVKPTSSDDLNCANSYKAYGSIAIGLGYPCSLGFGFDALRKMKSGNSNLGIHLNLLLAAPIARELPSDFEGLKPRDDVFMISAMLAYEYHWDEETSFGVSFGPTYLFIEETHFTEAISWFTLFSNYTTDEQQQNIPGLSIRLKENWSLKQRIGFEMAAHINVNSYSKIITMEFCFVFGKL